MIETLFQLGFALACAIAAVSLVFWALVILPDWVRRRRVRRRRAQRQAETEADT